MACFSGPEIDNTNLRAVLDKSNNKSYSGSGATWTDLVRNTTYTDTISAGAGNETWMGSDSSGITISLVINKIDTFVGYAEHPVNKWINTTDASFVLYHFGTTAGGLLNAFVWYGNVGGTWRDIGSRLNAVNGTRYAITLQYNDASGGQMWVNGNKLGARVGSGTRANSTNPLKIIGPVGSASSVVENLYMWDRELTDNEIRQNFEVIRGRYGI
jgi:hypothetical protein